MSDTLQTASEGAELDSEAIEHVRRHFLFSAQRTSPQRADGDPTKMDQNKGGGTWSEINPRNAM